MNGSIKYLLLVLTLLITVGGIVFTTINFVEEKIERVESTLTKEIQEHSRRVENNQTSIKNDLKDHIIAPGHTETLKKFATLETQFQYITKELDNISRVLEDIKKKP